MTTIDAVPDVCRGCAQPWRTGELFCSACGTARSGVLPTRPVVGSGRPGVVFAAQVMIGLSTLADAIMLLFGLAVLPLVASPGSATGGSGPLLFLVALAALIMLLAFVVLQLRAIIGIERRERSARTIVTTIPVIDAAVSLVLLLPLGLSGVAGGLSSWLISVPWAAVTIGLLWLPLDAKRWFRDLPVPGLSVRPQPADDGDWWAAEARRARSADNVPRTKRASRPRPVDTPSTGRHARPAATSAEPSPKPLAAPTGAPSFPSAPIFPTGPTPAVEKEPEPRPAPLPRAVPGAPQLPPDYGARLLARAGFPATRHNLFAVHERLAVMFRMRGLQFIEGLGTAQDRDLFARRSAPGEDPYGWAQLVLNAVVSWRVDSSPHIQDFYERYSAMLLGDIGSGSGFFGGSRDEPLPTMDDWR